MEIVYMDKEPTSKNMGDITITKAQFTGGPTGHSFCMVLRNLLQCYLFYSDAGASTVKEEDPDGDPTGFVINVSYYLLPTAAS